MEALPQLEPDQQLHVSHKVDKMILFENCHVFDGSDADLIENAYVVVDGPIIAAVGAGASPDLPSAAHIDCGGRYLMPGLIDAHVHVCAPSFSFFDNDRLPPSLLAAYAIESLQAMLMRGFTSVRDAGGADVGLELALQRGLIRGPRLFFSGRALSQTGGHGDMRPGDKIDLYNCNRYAGSISMTVDGVDAMRAAVREELRKGAHQIKLFVSGGVTSPTDPIWMNQFTDGEIKAAVEEAATRRTYVLAHCHTDEAARRCIELGVRSIEHGTHITPPTAKLIAKRGAFVVPTLSVADILRREGPSLGLPPLSLEKIEGAYESTIVSIKNCARANVMLGLGSDILGRDHSHLQGDELRLRGEVQKPVDVLRSATSVNAALLQRTGELGCIRAGAYADILVVDANPLEDLSIFSYSRRGLSLIMQNGAILSDRLS